MEKGLVSIVLLAYNHEKYITQCISSLAAQSYPAIEVIFIDAGSSDASFRKGTELLSEHKLRHVALETKGYGICKNLNLALAGHVKGEFFCVISADDWWPVENLKSKVEFLANHPAVPMVYSGVMNYVDETGEYQDPGKEYFSGKVYRQLLSDNFISAHAAVLRTEIFKTVGRYDEASAVEDWDMWLRIAQGHEIGFIPGLPVFYRRHLSNFSNNERGMLDSNLYILAKHTGDAVGRERYLKTLMFACANRAEMGKIWKAFMEYGRLDSFSARQLLKSILVKTGLLSRV